MFLQPLEAEYLNLLPFYCDELSAVFLTQGLVQILLRPTNIGSIFYPVKTFSTSVVYTFKNGKINLLGFIGENIHPLVILNSSPPSPGY